MNARLCLPFGHTVLRVTLRNYIYPIYMQVKVGTPVNYINCLTLHHRHRLHHHSSLFVIRVYHIPSFPSFPSFPIIREKMKIFKANFFFYPFRMKRTRKFKRKLYYLFNIPQWILVWALGHRFHGGKRKKNCRNDGRAKSNGQVLDAFSVGYKYHKSSSQRFTHNERSACADLVDGIIRNQAQIRLCNQLRYRVCTSSLYPGQPLVLSRRTSLTINYRIATLVDERVKRTTIIYVTFVICDL